MDGLLAHLDQTGMVFVLGLFALFAALLSGLCLLLYFRSSTLQKELWLEVADLKQRIESLKTMSQTASHQPSGQAFDKTAFKSRLENLSGQDKRIPEKYRHVAQLERSGLSSQEIAEILDVSRQEAEQMLALAKASKKSTPQGPD